MVFRRLWVWFNLLFILILSLNFLILLMFESYCKFFFYVRIFIIFIGMDRKVSVISCRLYG